MTTQRSTYLRIEATFLIPVNIKDHSGIDSKLPQGVYATPHMKSQAMSTKTIRLLQRRLTTYGLSMQAVRTYEWPEDCAGDPPGKE